jgi:hypothetical protein
MSLKDLYKQERRDKTVNALKDIDKLGKKSSDSFKEQSSILGIITGQYNNLNKLAKTRLEAARGELDLTSDQVKKLQDQVDDSEKLGSAIEDIAPGMVSAAKSAEAFGKSLYTALGPIGIVLAVVIGLGKAIMGVVKAVSDIRKDLGVSAVEAAKLGIAFKGLEIAGKFIGLEAEDFKESFKAARDNLGASRGEALALSFNLAKVAMQTGTSADQLTTVLSVMESVSSASREVLLAQLEINRSLAEQAGIAPADVFRDIAENAEFFAQFAKDGSTNLVQAGIAARKLGLNMSAVVGITESLLDFETSIEKQMEASVLLGRNINLDKARQLALAGKQDEMMGEILKQVGGEAEFNKMNVIQRKALAESVGVNVEQLSRLVRNNTAGGTAGAVNSAMGSQGQMQDRTLSAAEESLKVQKDMRTELQK